MERQPMRTRAGCTADDSRDDLLQLVLAKLRLHVLYDIEIFLKKFLYLVSFVDRDFPRYVRCRDSADLTSRGLTGKFKQLGRGLQIVKGIQVVIGREGRYNDSAVQERSCQKAKKSLSIQPLESLGPDILSVIPSMATSLVL